MSLAFLDPPARSALATSDYLGPAPVVAMRGMTPLVRVGDREVRAELALAFPYEPVAGDELLVIGKDDKFYVIGLLHAQGAVALRFVGDVKLHAVGGKLDLRGDQGVEVAGSTVRLLSQKLETVAGSIFERASEVYRRVKGTLRVHSGDTHELVDGELATRAANVNTTTSGVVAINGKEIHMG